MEEQINKEKRYNIQIELQYKSTQIPRLNNVITLIQGLEQQYKMGIVQLSTNMHTNYFGKSYYLNLSFVIIISINKLSEEIKNFKPSQETPCQLQIQNIYIIDQNQSFFWNNDYINYQTHHNCILDQSNQIKLAWIQQTSFLDQIISDLYKATNIINIITFQLSDSRVLSQLELCLINKVKVNIILNFESTEQKDISFYRFRYLKDIHNDLLTIGYIEGSILHEKSITIDNQIFYIGSSNLTFSGLSSNIERNQKGKSSKDLDRYNNLIQNSNYKQFDLNILTNEENYIYKDLFKFQTDNIKKVLLHKK